MHNIDIRKYKIDLREQCKKRRRELDPEIKDKMDFEISQRVRKLYQYRSAETILVYVSTSIEVDTKRIIKNAWADGKRVAVPRCIPYSRLMEFHYINSFDELSPGTFSVLEPDEHQPIVRDFSKTLMLVPAFMFSATGYRLGYGKGYYDRYMSRYNGAAVGLCYTEDFKLHMYHGRYDRPVDAVVTEKWIRNTYKNRSPHKRGLR
jgi:5-formyltetrahydrofolate cyclo-ligase